MNDENIDLMDEQDTELEALLAEPSSGKKKKKKRKPWSRKRKIISGVVAAGAVFLVATKVFGSNGEVAAMATTTALKQGTIQNKLSLSGPVTGTDSAEVVSNLHAEIQEILVKEGDRVMPGQVLAKLNPEDVQREVEIARTTYELAVANYDEAEKEAVAGYAKAKQDYQAAADTFSRTQVLYQSGGIPLVDYEKARNDLNDRKRDMESYTIEEGRPVAAKSYALQVKNSQFQLEQKQKLLDETEITSPIDGIVVRVNTRVGRFADVVDDDKPLFSIDNLDVLELKINVSEYSIGKVESGQKAVIRADILDGKVEEGVVTSISPTGEEKGGGSTERVIPITIQILNSQTGLIAGITAKAELVLEENENAWIVPISAVFEKDEQSYIAAVEDKVLHLIPVDKGIESDIEMQILEKQVEGTTTTLTADMRIVTNPNAEMADGQQVMEQPLG